MYRHYNDIHFHYHHHHQHHDLGGGGGQLIPWNWIHYFSPCPPVPGHHHFHDDDDYHDDGDDDDGCSSNVRQRVVTGNILVTTEVGTSKKGHSNCSWGDFKACITHSGAPYRPDPSHIRQESDPHGAARPPYQVAPPKLRNMTKFLTLYTNH